MLSQAQRTTILELNAQQVSKREIARVLEISRVAVRKVLRANSNAVPELHRAEKAEPHRQQILELFDQCRGNLVRVHEELVASSGAELSYAALTAFCRRHGIGYAAPTPAGQYDFDLAGLRDRWSSGGPAEEKARNTAFPNAAMFSQTIIIFHGGVMPNWPRPPVQERGVGTS